MKNILFSSDIYKFFRENDYQIIKPFNIVNNKDTVFYSAGIQPLLSEYLNGNIKENENLFIAQPVIRTQYLDTLGEGTSLAFINSTTSRFNLSEIEYKKLVNDWVEFFYQIGLEKHNITTSEDYYIDNWNNINLEGNRTFYYYNNIEIGDTTFFKKVDNDKIETMCDLGFGIERLRWCVNNNSYYDLYSDTKELLPREKALISALSLLLICNVKPSWKNSGYRARLFSKKLSELLDSRRLNELDLRYLKECITYWKDWQNIDTLIDENSVINEYERNCRSNIISLLVNEGYNVGKLNVNVSWDDFKSRLRSAGVPKERIKNLIR